MIINRSYKIPLGTGIEGLLAEVSRMCAGEILRWFIGMVGADGYLVETTECTAAAPPAWEIPAFLPAPPGKSVVISLIPTGIGCAVGGYAGDAAAATALLAAAAEHVITNPNALNASNFIGAERGVVYTEGYSLDLFSSGKVPLFVPYANKIGVIVERASDDALAEVINIINAVRAVHGVEIVDYIVTDTPIGTRCTRHASGAYTGRIDNPEVLLSAGRRLLSSGATALAVTTNVQDLPADAYMSHFAGDHPNPVGGAEAVVSHLLTRSLGVPAAHAPLLNFKQLPGEPRVVDARSSAEFVSRSGLACVLLGLRRAPQLEAKPGRGIAAVIGVDEVMAVIAPASALGSGPVLTAVQRGTPVIAVTANTTILDVTADRLGLPGVIEVSSYLEAAGAVLALRAGISLESVRRPLATFGLPDQPAEAVPIPVFSPGSAD
ncbi:MAG TPA: DUF3326 domain-containing protein [Streptosporangiaceae bacterium]